MVKYAGVLRNKSRDEWIVYAPFNTREEAEMFTESMVDDEEEPEYSYHVAEVIDPVVFKNPPINHTEIRECYTCERLFSLEQLLFINQNYYCGTCQKGERECLDR